MYVSDKYPAWQELIMTKLVEHFDSTANAFAKTTMKQISIAVKSDKELKRKAKLVMSFAAEQMKNARENGVSVLQLQ